MSIREMYRSIPPKQRAITLWKYGERAAREQVTEGAVPEAADTQPARFILLKAAQFISASEELAVITEEHPEEATGMVREAETAAVPRI